MTCREILPLVCKRFREVLREPSMVWEVRLGVASAPPGTAVAASTQECHACNRDVQLLSVFSTQVPNLVPAGPP